MATPLILALIAMGATGFIAGMLIGTDNRKLEGWGLLSAGLSIALIIDHLAR